MTRGAYAQRIMKTLASVLFVAALFVLLMTFSGCTQHEPAGLPDSARFEYDPAPELAEAFEAAATRIRKASGIELVSVPGATPIDHAFADEIDGDCGQTPITYHEEPIIIVDVYILIASDMPAGCQDEVTTLTHELIHSLRRREGIGADNNDHSETGLFNLHGGNGKLNESTLNKICEVADCASFNVEE